MSTLVNIATAVPTNKYKQEDLAGFTCDLFQYPEKRRNVLKTLYKRSGIETRYSVIPDYNTELEDRLFYPKTKNLEPFPDTSFRMQFYAKAALELSAKAILKCIDQLIDKNEITHLITVSCTGLSAPGLDIDLMQHLKLKEDIYRTSINFMGCYAAIHGLKQADHICRSTKDAKVIVICVELCSIHFQKIDDMDNITANLLFGDGAAAALVVPDDDASKYNGNNLKLAGFYSRIHTAGRSDMAWQVGSTGFLMTLSAYIPNLIESGIKELFTNAAEQLNIELSEIKYWAIHPGGKKILEVIQKELDLENDDLESSYSILRDYGNMSSASILFVLNNMLTNKIITGESSKIFGVAFGPGLTMESMILENV
jgi:predicted naringenin-chalcone synthase